MFPKHNIYEVEKYNTAKNPGFQVWDGTCLDMVVKCLKWCLEIYDTRGNPIDKVCCKDDGFAPKGSWHIGTKERGMNYFQ
ncbi:unnamed protein product [Prunus armeniaca]